MGGIQSSITSNNYRAMYFFLILAAFSCMVQADEWSEYKEKHGKVYATEEEDFEHWMIWAKNVESINKHNSENGADYEQEVNEFTDMTDEEYGARMGAVATDEEIDKAFAEGEEYVPAANLEDPAEIDWRTRGYVTEVKNQGHCGSCYSFSATGALEVQWFKKTGQLISLSESQIVDCAGHFGNHGCRGGMPDRVYNYLGASGGDETESAYPYVPAQQRCRFQRSLVAAKVKGTLYIKRGSERDLKKAVAQLGPISIVIYATKPGFRHYKRGVYSDPECQRHTINHAVLLVGYGYENGIAYWLVKNSWGAGWGEGGYIKMAQGQNICQITYFPV